MQACILSVHVFACSIPVIVLMVMHMYTIIILTSAQTSHISFEASSTCFDIPTVFLVLLILPIDVACKFNC